MQYSARGLKTTPSRGSQVLFGVRTSSLTETSSPKAFLANSGVKEDIPATHMVVQAEDPFTGVRFARTYFLSSGKVCNRVVDDDALVSSLAQSNPHVGKTAVDTQTLIEMYALLVRSFKTGTSELVRECMDGKVASLDRCIEFPTKFIDDQLSLTAEIMDARGQQVDSLTEDWCLLYCSMTLADIPSCADPALPLGSLVIGDTFLFHGRDSRSLVELDTKRFLHVTKPFANFRSWIQGGEEADAIDLLMRALQSEFILQSRSVCLGKAIDSDFEANEARDVQVSMSSKATLLFNSEFLPIVHGNWRVFSGGFVFSCPNFNPIVVSIERSVKSLTILPSSYEELVLLKLEFKPDEHSQLTPLSSAIPFTLDCQDIYIPMQSGSRFQDEIFRALEAWKDTAAALNIPIYRTSDLSETFEGDTPRDHEGANFDVPNHVKSTCERLVLKQIFVGQDARTVEMFFPQHFIPKDPNAVTTLPRLNTEDISRLIVPVTIMLGIPGSGVQSLSQSVCQIASASFDWRRSSVHSIRGRVELAHAPVSYRFEIVPGMDWSKFSYLVAKTLTPFAAMAKATDRIYPMESKATKGIRIAQAIAVEKVRQDGQTSAATSFAEGVFSNGQSRSCWCVEGQVVFKDEPGCVYEYRSSGTFARLWVDADRLRNKAESLPSLELKITGLGLNAEKLRDHLLNCYAHAEASPSQIRSKASITLDEKREIQRQHAMDPLPDGYMFDGTNYVDFFGGRYEFHPCIAQFIDEYITAVNDDRKATNLKALEEREYQQSFVRQMM
ncbi:hypothetical protein PInf_013191 [Phytophthora infestans]|nr:hypothetical protein PInf_013191 [Phytophthora infestans]